jgi:sensor c-di-GMP phosphodiesterase-like protein
LRQAGYCLAQGHLYGHAMAAADFEQRFASPKAPVNA